MFGYLKQSTATQGRMVGPLIDDTDFKTVETALTILNTDVKLSKNGAVSVNKNSGGGTHRDNGMYSLTFDATDTNTVGELEGSILVTGALVVVFKFVVLEETVYDALFGAAAPGYLQPTTDGNKLDVTATGAAGIDWGNVENKTTVNDLTQTDIQQVDTCVANTDMVGTNSAALASVCTETRLSELDAATGGKVANQVDLIKTDTGNIKTEADKIALVTAGAGVAGSLIEEVENRATPTQVNTEVLDVLNVDTFAEPGQETPPATTTLIKKIGYIYKFLRNRVTTTATEVKVFNDDATTVDQKSTHSDNATTYDRGEFITGP